MANTYRQLTGFFLAALAWCVFSVAPVLAVDYHVGPGQTYQNIVDVPWYQLTAGDTVFIHYRAQAYHEKFLVSGNGTQSNTIRVIGVPGPNGERPVIDGTNAVSGQNYWPAGQIIYNYEQYSIINVHSRVDSEAHKYTRQYSSGQSSWIEIKNLEIKSASNGGTFTDSSGSTNAYSRAAACIDVHYTDHVTIENNVIHDCGNGIFMAPNYYGGVSDVIVRNNYLYDNGTVGRWSQHQSYIEADKVIYEGNFYGLEKAGTWGSQLKDRSAGAVVRYNYFMQAAGRTTDLVETQNSVGIQDYQLKPYYRQVFVYGNVFKIGDAQGTPFHVGADDDPTVPRDQLYFYHNTVVRDPGEYSSLFDTGDSGQNPTGQNGFLDLRNNIFYIEGRLNWSRLPWDNYRFGINWVSPNWRFNKGATTASVDPSGPCPGYVIYFNLSNGRRWYCDAGPAWTEIIPSPELSGLNNLISSTSNDPGFLDIPNSDYHLVAGSPVLGVGGPLADAVTNNALGMDLTPNQQYMVHQLTTARALSGAGSDAGAFGFSTVSNTHVINTSAGGNGSIAPSGAIMVPHGASQAFTITPESGYRVANVLVDGISVGTVTAYAFTSVSANHTIAASFSVLSPVTPSPTAPGKDMNVISPKTGDVAQITFTLDAPGHVIVKVYSRGDFIKEITSQDYPAGTNDVTWDGKNAAGEKVASGIYSVTIDAGGKKSIKKKVAVLR